jgi:hypothetical protein
MTESAERVGEVIEASTTQFVAECYELYQPPPLGSLVQVGDAGEELLGVVYYATTASLEPGRRPIARGKDEASEKAVYEASPQLEKLLRSEFSTLVVGHAEGSKLLQYLPARPARIHSFVYRCTPESVRDFSTSFDFLSLLLDTSMPVPVEELVAATLRQMSEAHEDRRSFLIAVGKELATLLSGEYGRLRSILGRIIPPEE